MPIVVYKTVNECEKIIKNNFKTASKFGYLILMLVTAAMGVALLAFSSQSLDILAITIGAIYSASHL